MNEEAPKENDINQKNVTISSIVSEQDSTSLNYQKTIQQDSIPNEKSPLNPEKEEKNENEGNEPARKTQENQNPHNKSRYGKKGRTFQRKKRPVEQIDTEKEQEELEGYEFEATKLPKGWAMVLHENLVPFYFHQESGVISWTKPYVRTTAIKKHNPPLSAFSSITKFYEKQIQSSGEYIEKANTKRKKRDEAALAIKEKLNEATKLGDAVTVSNLSKELIFDESETHVFPPDLELEMPEIPEDVKKIQGYLIMLVGAIVNMEKKKRKRNYEAQLLGPTEKTAPTPKYQKKNTVADLTHEGKTPISFLQEYCFHILHKSPNYKTTIQEDPENPFLTIVYIDDVEYGRGAFATKKHSKQLAAERALSKLCPDGYYPSLMKEREEMKKKMKNFEQVSMNVPIDDENVRLMESQSKTPAQILEEVSSRNHYIPKMESKQVRIDGEDKFEYTITIENHVGVGLGRTKREAKHRAAQAVLKKLYPHLSTWRQILEECDSSKYQNDDDRPGLNINMLEKLKKEMEKEMDFYNQQAETFHTQWSFRDTTKKVQEL